MKAMFRYFAFSVSMVLINQTDLYAQTQEDEVRAVIMRMFDGMRKGDSTMVSSAFSRESMMQTVGTDKDGKTIINNGSLKNFLKAVGTPHDLVWDERIEFGEIKIDEALATVWTPYSFYRGDQFSHCGVNSFQLYKSEKGWKIIYIIDTRRQSDCR